VNLEGHTKGVTSLAFSPDGKTLASGSYDHSVRIWDLATGKERATFQEHTSPVLSVAFDAEGKTLVSATVRGHALAAFGIIREEIPEMQFPDRPLVDFKGLPCWACSK
jgi:predicted NACHT family NTPase